MKKHVILLAVIFVVVVSGCGSKGPDSVIFLREGIDLNYIDRVAILPFESFAGGEGGAKRIRDIAITETLASGKFDVIEKGVVDATLMEMAISNQAPMDAPILKILSKRLGVKGFITGSVNSLSSRGGYGYPEVSLTLHLIDAETAEILWRSTSYKNGYSLWNRLFDLAPIDEFEITLLLLREMLGSIPK